MKYANIENIPVNPKVILDYAKSKSFNFWIDEKGTEKYPDIWTRKESDLSFDEAFEIIQNNKPLWVFSFRNMSYLTIKENDYWEFGGCNLANNDYGEVFIWIQVDVDIAHEIFHKFNLKIQEY